MTEEMYEDLLKRKQLQIDEYWELINEQDNHIVDLQSQLTEKDKSIENAKEVFADNERLLFENADLKKQIEELQDDNKVMADNYSKMEQEFNNKVEELKSRNAELRGNYVHSAREAETYKQFCEQKDKQIEKMKKYIKACWVEENLNGYSSYITNTSNEFIDLVKELNSEVKNGR